MDAQTEESRQGRVGTKRTVTRTFLNLLDAVLLRGVEGEGWGGHRSVRDGTVRVRYVPTDWNYADIMTKPLMEVKFKRCRDMCVTPRTGDKDRSVDVDENASAFMLIFDHTS